MSRTGKIRQRYKQAEPPYSDQRPCTSCGEASGGQDIRHWFRSDPHFPSSPTPGHGRDRIQSKIGQPRPRDVAWKAGTLLSLQDAGGRRSRVGMRARDHRGRDHEDLSQREDSEQFTLVPTNMCFGVTELPKFRSMVEAAEGGGVG